MEWLSHSQKKHCELCKTPFRFTKLYDADMPAQLPWDVFIKRALIHVGQGISNTGRAFLVGMVWMVILPWFIRWAWRWMFWILDAGWARELYLYRIKRAAGEQLGSFSKMGSGLKQAGQHILSNSQIGSANDTVLNAGYKAYNEFASNLGVPMGDYNSTGLNETIQTPQWPQADTSIFSSWTYLSELTPDPGLNRVLLDVFEGQLITCVVIIGFILIFLIREWVVQQQPLVNMDQLNNVQQQLREAADRVQEENERFRRQQELLDQARRRLVELQQETEDAQRQNLETQGFQRPEFIGWERLEEMIDVATSRLNSGDIEGFEARAPIVTEQIRAAGYESDIDLDSFTDKIYSKLASLPDAERKQWEGVLVGEARAKSLPLEQLGEETSLTDGAPSGSAPDSAQAGEVGSGARPPMPEREFSSRATQIQRLLEEADGIFGQVHGDAANRADAELPPAEAGPSTAGSSSTESWQNVSQQGEPSLADKLAELSERMTAPEYDAEKEEIPITNAGPDAKTNIKRSGVGKPRAVPEPGTEEKSTPAKEGEDSTGGVSEPANEEGQAAEAVEPLVPESHPVDSATEAIDARAAEDPTPNQTNNDTLANYVGSAFREEFGLDDMHDHADRGLAGIGLNQDAPAEDAPAAEENHEHPPADLNQHGLYERLADWFWGEIHATNAPEPVPDAREERVDDQGDQQQPALADPADPEQAQQQGQDHVDQPDPEVAAAAAQAGLDAEAIEDAEELEGIFELIGLQGPLMALFQTSMFCLVLVSGTVISAVGLPYAFGKLVLSFIGSPVYFIFKLPLQSASFVADFVIDTSLFVGGWTAMVIGLISEVIYTALRTLLRLPSSSLLEKLTNACMKTATASGTRLQSLFITESNGDMGLNGLFLGWSVHSHGSLRTLQDEINAVLDFVGRGIFFVAEGLSSGSFSGTWSGITNVLSHVPAVPTRLMSGVSALQQYVNPVLESLKGLKTGALTLNVPSNSPASINPTLVFWHTSDRVAAVFTGYVALAMLAALYVAADTPITSSAVGQRYEKTARDTLRQAGGVLKVILIISIEMLVFPLYCGLLLDLAFLPLFGGASVSTRLAFAASHPYTFCFTHWFVGTCYMFHFALFVGMCRKILRKGVLWFIRDPDDPTFHPVRDVLERNVTTQLRKIAFSALVYGALVILCLGGVIWTIGKLFKGIFPIQWITTEPVLEFPVDLLLYNFVTPLLVRLFKPSDAVNALYAWWLRRCARRLRLSHFLFDDRRKDEEGHHVHKTWTSLLLMRKADTNSEAGVPGHQDSTTSEPSRDIHFQRDGKYVLTPCNDQYRPPKAGEAFLHTDDEDVYIADKDGKKNDHFAKIYVPPLFRVRVTLFMVCLWMFSATTGLCATLVPLVFGRRALDWAFPGVKLNDIYAYTLGAYTLSGVTYTVVKSRHAASYLRDKLRSIDLRTWATKTANFALRSAKCVYFYGFLGVALPTAFAFVLQFYLIMPLHTYMVASAHMQKVESSASDAANATAHSFTQTDTSRAPAPTGAWVTSHNIHLLQDFALGLLYCRIVSRAIASGPSSRAKEAFRRITTPGYLDPNVRLATRFFVLPALLIAAFAFLLPPLGAWTFVNTATRLGFEIDEEGRTLIYRFAFPCVGVLVAGFASIMGIARATERWRARVRDEVYLVGERLHNFGEKKPPAGTKSVVRRARVQGRREVDLEP